MKNLILMAVFLPLLFKGQTTEEKLKLAWGEKKYNEYVKKFPDSLEYYKFIIESGFRISKVEYVAPEKIANATEITIPESWIENGNINFNKFNIIKLGIPLNSQIDNYYVIRGTDYILIMKSKNYLESKFKARK